MMTMELSIREVVFDAQFTRLDQTVCQRVKKEVNSARTSERECGFGMLQDICNLQCVKMCLCLRYLMIGLIKT